MDQAFRTALRAALILTIALGVGLVVYAFYEEQPRTMQSGEAEPLAAGNDQPTGPDPEPAIEADPAPEQQPTRPPAPEAGPGMELENFSQPIEDPEGKVAAELSGPTAVYSNGVWQISEPLLLARLARPDGENSAQEFETVRVTAQEANWDEGEAIVVLSRDVAAEGKNLWVSLDRVTYGAADHMLRSESHVRIRRDRVDAQGVSRPAMFLSGDGLQVNLPLREMTIQRNVRTRLYDVSRDFLAGETPGPESPDHAPGTEVIIKSRGKAVYEHLTRRVTYNEAVTVRFGGKKLVCDRLSVQLDRNEGKDSLEVTDILATGNVTLSQQDQVLSGDTMEWHNVTQGGVLRGEPAAVETAEFRISGNELTFYRLNDRFHSEGPGRLLWKGTGQAPAEEPAEETTDGDWPSGPFRMNKDAAVHIRWQKSMTYDAAASSATFQKNVRVKQGQSSLSCQNLKVEFNEEAGQITAIDAQGKVGFVDELTGTVREVLCERLVWDGDANTIDLSAAEGQSVNISAGERQIAAPRVVFDNSTRALRCPEGGHLLVHDRQAAPDPAEQKPLAMDVRWQGPMEFRQGDRPVATFEGGIRARRQGQTVTTDSLKVEFDENTDPARITAAGNAVLEVAIAPPQSNSEQPAGPAEGPVLPGIGAGEEDLWQLTSSSLVIEPAQQVIRSPSPGRLALLGGHTPSGSIEWQQSMELNSSAGHAEFEGAVVAGVAGAALESNVLKIDFDQSGRLQHVSAQEEVVFTAGSEEPPWRVQSNSAEAVFASESVLKHLIARGDVQIARPNHALNAGRVQIFLQQVEGQEDPVVSRAVADENVWVWYEQEERLEAGGDRLEWDKDSDTYVLTGDPNCYVRRGDVRLQNWKIIVDPASGRASAPAGERLTTTRAGGGTE